MYKLTFFTTINLLGALCSISSHVCSEISSAFSNPVPRIISSPKSFDITRDGSMLSLSLLLLSSAACSCVVNGIIVVVCSRRYAVDDGCCRNNNLSLPIIPFLVVDNII